MCCQCWDGLSFPAKPLLVCHFSFCMQGAFVGTMVSLTLAFWLKINAILENATTSSLGFPPLHCPAVSLNTTSETASPTESNSATRYDHRKNEHWKKNPLVLRFPVFLALKRTNYVLCIPQRKLLSGSVPNVVLVVQRCHRNNSCRSRVIGQRSYR